jgi:hypothetical protein
MQPIPQTVAFTPSADHDTDTASSTVAAVFNVQELLESILFYLPVVDLVRSRRVNKTLHRIIETSPKLLRKLFLLPINDFPKYWGWESKNGITEFVTTLSSLPSAPETPRRRKRRRPNIIARLHPLIEADEWDHILSPDETLAVKLVFDTRIDRRILNSKVGHRRRGVRLSICEAQFALDRYSVTMMSAGTEFEGQTRQSL